MTQRIAYTVPVAPLAAKLLASTFALTLALGFAACGVAEEGDTGIPVEDLLEVGGKADGARAARFETFVGQDGRTYFHLLAANGQKVLHSQGYAFALGADEGIASVRANGAQPESYDLLEAKDGQWYFNVVAANGQIVASSELYVTRANAERAVATVAGLVQAAGVAPAAPGARFQVFRGLDGQHYFHLRAGNGEIVLQSEGYTRRDSARGGVASVLAHGADLTRFQVRDAADGQAYFVLVASNGQVIGVSETYASRASAEQGAAAVAALLAPAAAQEPAPTAQQPAPTAQQAAAQ